MARMIVFWSPYIMILTSVAVCDLRLWTFLVNKLNQSSTNQVLVSFLRHLVLCFLLAVIYISHKDAILAHLEELREFWDPDTVDLMEWIQQKVPLNAAFTGMLFRNKRFMLDEVTWWNASKFGIFYIYENPKSLFSFLI